MTTTTRTQDADLMELVHSVDPLEEDVFPATDEAAEALLREILAGPRPERSPGTRRGRTVVVRLQ